MVLIFYTFLPSTDFDFVHHHGSKIGSVILIRQQHVKQSLYVVRSGREVSQAVLNAVEDLCRRRSNKRQLVEDHLEQNYSNGPEVGLKTGKKSSTRSIPDVDNVAVAAPRGPKTVELASRPLSVLKSVVNGFLHFKPYFLEEQCKHSALTARSLNCRLRQSE